VFSLSARYVYCATHDADVAAGMSRSRCDIESFRRARALRSWTTWLPQQSMCTAFAFWTPCVNRQLTCMLYTASLRLPLYFRGAEEARFMQAVQLLNRDIIQVTYLTSS